MSKKIYIGTSERLTQIEYLQSTGTQYIDTGFIPNQDTRVVMDVMHTGELTDNIALFGGRESLTGNSFTLWWYVNARTSSRFDYIGTTENKIVTNYVPTNDIRITVDANKNVWRLGDYSSTMTYSDSLISYNLALLGVNTTGTITKNFTGRIYSCQIYDNDILVRDFVPVLDSANVACLYDKVEEKLYYNAGTGDFNVSYTELEYIESMGAQYIDTGISDSNGFTVDMDIMITDNTQNDDGVYCFIGSQTDSKPWYCNFIRLTDETYFTIGAYSEVNESTGTATLNTKINIDASTLVGASYLNVDGISKVTSTNSTARSSNNLFIFAINGDNDTAYQFAWMRLYKCKLYDSNRNLVRDFIPVKDANGTVCLYDKISARFYYNQGTDNFVAGSVITTTTNPQDAVAVFYKEVAKEVKSVYLGINDTAREVIKGYVGIGGVARPFWDTTTEISYYGTITPLSVARMNLMGAVNDSYAVFASGKFDYDNTKYYSTVDAYDVSLVHYTPASLATAQRAKRSTSFNNYAIFAGGYPYSTNIECYDNTLTKTIPATAPNKSYDCFIGTVGDYMIYAGGADSMYSTVAAYDKSFTRTSCDNLQLGRCGGQVASVGEYVIFAGGPSSWSKDYSDVVDAYSSSLTHSICDNLSKKVAWTDAGTIGNYAVFPGGAYYNNAGVSAAVDIYDDTLTHFIITPLAIGRSTDYGIDNLGENLIIAGGWDGRNDENLSIVGAFDTSLTYRDIQSLSEGRNTSYAVTLGNYFIHAGGGNSDSSGVLSSVEVYTII